MDQPLNQGVAEPAVATKSHTWLAVLITVVVLTLGAAGVAWGFLRYSRSPEAKIMASFENLGKINTYGFEGTLTVKGEVQKMNQPLTPSELSTSGKSPAVDPEAQFTLAEVGVIFRGESDQSVDTQPASEIFYTVSLKNGDKTYPTFSLDFVSRDKILAFRIPSLPVMGSVDLTELNNQWISVDFKKIEEQLGSLLPANAGEKLSTLEDKAEVEKVVEHLKKIAAKRPPIKVTRRFKSEMIDGVKTQAYRFTMNKKNAALILDKLAEAEAETGVSRDAVGEMKKVLAQVKKLEGTIWLGAKNDLPYRLKVAAQFIDETTDKPVDVQFAVNWKDFNRPVDIVLPVSALTLEEALNKATAVFLQKSAGVLPTESGDLSEDVLKFSTSTSGAEASVKKSGDPSTSELPTSQLPTSGSTSGAGNPGSVPATSPAVEEIDTDGDGLTDLKEDYYGTNKLKKDTDGDGYDDLKEIESGHDPLR